MKKNHFTIHNNKLLCWRLGPMNAQRQKHYSKIVTVNGLEGEHKPPESRGIWAFPYPYYDLFFCFHQYSRHLPKKFNEETVDFDSMSDEEAEKYWEEQENVIKQIRRRIKPSTFYAGEFYSHIFPNGQTDYNEWFYWDSVRDWSKVANKILVVWHNFNGDISAYRTGCDHLELFITKF